MELREVTYADIIDDYLATFQANMSVKDVVYKVVKDNLINKKAIRDKCIVSDFDEAIKKNNCTVRSIFDDLTFKYNLSFASINLIVYSR